VDELNNIDELTVDKSKKASDFAKFVKDYFVSPAGRYFVFSTHIHSTLESFGVFLDPSNSSERAVFLQELPLVDNLSAAKILNKGFLGSREAVHHGLMPGLIHDRAMSSRNSIAIKRLVAINNFNREASLDDREASFVSILKSLLDGNVERVPERLHALLDATPALRKPVLNHLFVGRLIIWSLCWSG